MLLSAFVLFGFVFLLLLYCIGIINHGYFKNTDVKFLKPIPFLGNYGPLFSQNMHLSTLVANIFETFQSEKYCGFFSFFAPVIWILDGELVKQVAIKDFECFVDHSHPVIDEIDPLYANMLVALRGRKWKDMRAHMTPAFTSAKIKLMYPLVKECTDQLINYVDAEVVNSEKADVFEIDVKEIFGQWSVDVIASIAFGLKINTLDDKNHMFFKMAKKFANADGRLGLIYTINMLCPIISKIFRLKLMEKESEQYFKDIVLNTIKNREEKGIKRFDMIDLLIDAKNGCLKDEESNGSLDENTNEGKKVWTDDELTGVALIFFLAGYETISSALSFTAYLLSQNPIAQRRLHEEIDSVPDDQNNMYDHIMKMKYLEMVLSEVLRLYPSVIVADRVCTKPCTLSPPNENSKKGYRMNVGDYLVIHIRAIMRDARNFPEPEKFDPERFSDENKHKILPYTYLPFGIGPRQCIAKRLSYMEMKTVLFYFFSNYEVFATPNTTDPLKNTKNIVNLMPNGKILIGLRKRKC